MAVSYRVRARAIDSATFFENLQVGVGQKHRTMDITVKRVYTFFRPTSVVPAVDVRTMT